MNIEERRKTLSKWILETDENVLNEVEAIYNVKSGENATDTVAYTINGEPLTKEMYIQKIKEAEASFDAGKFITSKELKNKMLSW